MNKDFEHCTLKQKLSNVLLYCMRWGYNIKGEIDFDERVRKKLKLQNNNDTLRLRSCIDLIEDTEYAIIHFSKFGLQRFSMKNNDIGEMYLKLYGILNAVYLQTWAIIELIEICRFPEKSRYIEELMRSEIIEIRNVAGSHTVTFKQQEKNKPEKYKKNFYRIAQVSISPKCDQLIAVDGFDDYKEYNLYESLMIYNSMSDTIMYKIAEKYLFSLFGKASLKPKEIFEYYDIDCFSSYNYRGLYQNDKAQKRFFKSLDKEFKNLHDKK